MQVCTLVSGNAAAMASGSAAQPGNLVWSITRTGAAISVHPIHRAAGLVETVNGLYKAEVIQRPGPWKSFEAVEYATLEWVDWFNNRRLLEPIGNIPPAGAEQSYHDTVSAQQMAA